MPFDVRLFSTPESVRRGELSMLAIAETIAASGLSFWLAWRLGSIEHIVLASAITPFLLLRTRLSTRFALHLFTEIHSISDDWRFRLACCTVGAFCVISYP
jgi:hypothetical protein